MATDKAISAFTLLDASDVQPGDLFVIVDTSDTSSSPSGTTKSVLLSSLLNNPQNGTITGVLVPIQGTAAPGDIVKTVQNGMVFQSSGGSLTDYLFLDLAGNQIAAGRASDSAWIATKFMGVSGAPTVAVGSGAGSGATASVVGSDTCGVITLTTGTSCTIGDVCTVTFSNPYGNGVVAVAQYESSDWLLTNQPTLMTAATTSTFTIRVSVTALTDSVPYKFNYQVMGYGN